MKQLLIHEKKCRVCKETKTIDNFFIRISNRDGLETRCKDCVRTYVREWKMLRNPKIEVKKVEGRLKKIPREFTPSGKTTKKELDLEWEEIKKINLREKTLRTSLI